MFAHVTTPTNGQDVHGAELHRVTTTQMQGLPEGFQLGASLSGRNSVDIQHGPSHHSESARSLAEHTPVASSSRSHRLPAPFASQMHGSCANLAETSGRPGNDNVAPPQLEIDIPSTSSCETQARVVVPHQYKPLPAIPPYAVTAPIPSASLPPDSSDNSSRTAEFSHGSLGHRPPPLQLSLPSTSGVPLFSAYPLTSSRRRASATMAQPPSSYKGREREAYDTLSSPIDPLASNFAAIQTRDRRRSYQDLDFANTESQRPRSMSHSSGRHHGPPLSHSAHFVQPFQNQALSLSDLPSQRCEPSCIPEETPFTPTPRRQRAMTLEQNVAIVTRDLSADGRRRSADQAAHTLAASDISLSSGWLPPGALPAVNPASKSTFELTAESQYEALGGIDMNRIGSPVKVLRVSDQAINVRSYTDHHIEGPTRAFIPSSVDSASISNQQPYTWANASEAMFTLQSVSTVEAGVPLVSPAPSQRSNAVAKDFFSSKSLLPGSLGLTEQINSEIYAPIGPHEAEYPALQIDLSGRSHAEDAGDVVSPLQMSPDLERNSSIDRGMSMPSMTETSSGAGTAEFLLSSASTSLSRSTKNGKEKDSNIEGIHVAQGDHHDISEQLSLALETQLLTKKNRIDRRKYILVELVETEMAYTDHLRDLVHIYLPQLAALSIVSPSQHATIGRNLKEMLYFHEQLTNRMVDVLKEEGLGTNLTITPGVDESVRVERIARKIAAVFVEDASGFDMYDKYCSGAAAANNIIRDLQHRPEWASFEKRCRIVIATRSNTPLQQVLAEDNPHFQPSSMPPPTVSSIPSRLMLRDLLILPVQRICRYPLVLSTLMSSAAPSSPSQEGFFTYQSALDVGVEVERAMAVMRDSASRANIANRRSMVLARTAIITRRLEYHPLVTRSLLASLGPCVLSGALDVLYHHPSIAPLQSTVKVRYMGAFLYYGFLVLAKIKKAEHYEIKHYLPLQMFEMVDVTEGLLPHSIRLTFRDHHIELAAACAEEKNVWATALCEARDNSSISPFDLPCSVAYGVGRSRRESTFHPGESLPASALSPKRYSLAVTDFGMLGSNPFNSDDHDGFGFKVPDSPRSPVVPASPMRREGFPHHTPSRILMRRASPLYRLSIDSNLQDVVCDECNIARAAGKQMANDVFGAQTSPATASAPGTLRNRLSMKDSSVLRRRRSYVDVRSSASTDTLTSAVTVTNSISRAMSGYSNNMATSFKRGFSISSQEGSKPKNRLSTGSLDCNACSDVTGDVIGAAEKGVTLADAVPTPDRNHYVLCADYTGTTAIRTAQRQTMQDNQLASRTRSKSEMSRRRSMQNLNRIWKPKHNRANSVPVSPVRNLAVLSGSETDHEGGRNGAPESGASGATTPSHIGEYTTVDVYALGAGLTNALTSTSGPSRPGLLSRTMSFQKRSRSSIFGSDSVFGGSRRNSIDLAKAMPINALTFSPIQGDVKPALPSVPGSPTGSCMGTVAPNTLDLLQTHDRNSTKAVTSSVPPSTNAKLEFTHNPAGSVVSESTSTNTSDVEDAASCTSVGSSDPPLLVKRRRSIRFFHRLNQFTSLSSGNADK